MSSSGKFHLNKWYLDFVDDKGSAMIFYSAELTWYGIKLKYASWLQTVGEGSVKVRHGFRSVQLPQLEERTIHWQHHPFDVSGSWQSKAKSINTRIVDMPQGVLDWNCFQPSSAVALTIDGKVMKGSGYAEQLLLTIPPWQIPMHELRWGRFISENSNLVWIELKEVNARKWLWLNSEKQEPIEISDESIIIPGKNLHLHLDQSIVLESEKKIHTIVEKLVRYIPGFKRAIPLNFLWADEYKWFSNGLLSGPGDSLEKGTVIHELVNFQPKRNGITS